MTTKPTTAEQAQKALNFLHKWRHELALMEENDDDHGVFSFIEAALQSEREKADGVTVEEFLRAYIDRSDYHTDTEYEFAETCWKIIAEAIMNKFPNGLKIIKGE